MEGLDNAEDYAESHMIVYHARHIAEYRQSCDLRALEVKQVHAQKLKYLTLWRLATERKQVLKKERLAYNVSRGY